MSGVPRARWEPETVLGKSEKYLGILSDVYLQAGFSGLGTGVWGPFWWKSGPKHSSVWHSVRRVWWVWDPLSHVRETLFVGSTGTPGVYFPCCLDSHINLLLHCSDEDFEADRGGGGICSRSWSRQVLLPPILFPAVLKIQLPLSSSTSSCPNHNSYFCLLISNCFSTRVSSIGNVSPNTLLLKQETRWAPRHTPTLHLLHQTSH